MLKFVKRMLCRHNWIFLTNMTVISPDGEKKIQIEQCKICDKVRELEVEEFTQ